MGDPSSMSDPDLEASVHGRRHEQAVGIVDGSSDLAFWIRIIERQPVHETSPQYGFNASPVCVNTEM
jgi:hypothetical protein